MSTNYSIEATLDSSTETVLGIDIMTPDMARLVECWMLRDWPEVRQMVILKEEHALMKQLGDTRRAVGKNQDLQGGHKKWQADELSEYERRPAFLRSALIPGIESELNRHRASDSYNCLMKEISQEAGQLSPSKCLDDSVVQQMKIRQHEENARRTQKALSNAQTIVEVAAAEITRLQAEIGYLKGKATTNSMDRGQQTDQNGTEINILQSIPIPEHLWHLTIDQKYLFESLAKDFTIQRSPFTLSHARFLTARCSPPSSTFIAIEKLLVLDTKVLTQERVLHSLSCSATAIRMSKRYGLKIFTAFHLR